MPMSYIRTSLSSTANPFGPVSLTTHRTRCRRAALPDRQEEEIELWFCDSACLFRRLNRKSVDIARGAS